MTSQHSPVHVVEELGETTALIIDNDFPFLADTVAEKLRTHGCEVDRNPKFFRAYDYIVVLGLTRKIRQTIKKNPREFPFIKHLKNRGKAIIVTSQVDELSHRQTGHAKLFVLDSTRTFSATTLSDRILRTLFTSKSIHKKEPDHVVEKHKTASQPEEKDHEDPKASKHKLRLALVIATLTLFLSPLIIYMGTAVVSGFWVEKALDEQIPIADRKQVAEFAGKSASITNATGEFLGSIISPFSPTLANQTESTGKVILLLSQTVSEGLVLEDQVKQQFQSLFKEGKPDALEKEIPALQESLTLMESHLAEAVEASKTMFSIEKVPFVNKYHPLAPKLEDARRLISESREAIVLIPHLLAFDAERTYLLLFQNNFELRPTGGFIGSFGLLSVKNGSIADITVEDVYEADGQLKGAVIPPDPIRIHLNQPNWFLRDSNWNPDFTVSAQQAEWFLDKELGKTVDGVIAVDLYFVKSLLQALDGVYVPGYKARVTAHDFFIKLQSDTHDDFFPGSNEKKNLLSSLLTALTIELKDRKSLPYPQLARAVTDSLTRKNALIYFHDQKSQEIVEKLGWAGKLIAPGAQNSSVAPIVLDYTMLVEANVGVNKVNYHIEREIINAVSATENTINREVTIYYKNNSPVSDSLFSGIYKNYLRVLMPKEAEIKSINIGNKQLSLSTEVVTETIAERKIAGFLVEVPQQHELKTVIRYSLPIPVAKRFDYYLIMQKQPGTNQDPFVFKTGTSSAWDIKTTTIPTLPYLSDLSVDRLMSLDFTRQIE